MTDIMGKAHDFAMKWSANFDVPAFRSFCVGLRSLVEEAQACGEMAALRSGADMEAAGQLTLTEQPEGIHVDTEEEK